MLDPLRRHLPTRESLERRRGLRWLAPYLAQPQLWHWSRHGVALGVALGIFFGLLVPIAQMPLSAAAAIALRVHVPSAIAATLVTNPVTFAPVYLAAWQVGNLVLGQPAQRVPAPATAVDADHASWWRAAAARMAGVGKPLIVGLAIFAVAGAGLAYAVISAGWWVRTRWRRRTALRQRAARDDRS